MNETTRRKCGSWFRLPGANHHLRRGALRVYRQALRSGDLVRQPCTVCGSSRSEGHHEDYAEPTHVVWLCRFHHSNRHQGHGIEEMRSWHRQALTLSESRHEVTA